MADQNNAPELPDRIWAWSEDDDFLRAKPHGVMHGTEYVRADRAAPEGQGYFGPMGIPHWSRALTPPPAAQEPVAWMFELATMQDAETGEYGGWEGTKLGLCKPKVPEGSIRNLMPLYAAPPPPCQKEAVTDAELAKARAEIERLTKERDLSKELLRSCIQGNNVLRKKAQKAIAERDEARSMLADAERDMRQRAADSCLGLMTAQSARKFILALPLKHADRENDAALAQGQKEGD